MLGSIRVVNRELSGRSCYPAASPSKFCRRYPYKSPACRSASQANAAFGSPGLSRRSRDNNRSRSVAHGILDAYRKDKGLLQRQREAFSQSSEARRPDVDDNDDEVCQAECVREIKRVEELDQELDQGGEKTLIVVDFYKTACGSCRYIQPGFVKLCQASVAGHAPVVFLKHNIFDDYEELSELSQRYKIRSVPMFMFWKGGKVVEQFATRERTRVAKAINKHAGYEVLEPS